MCFHSSVRVKVDENENQLCGNVFANDVQFMWKVTHLPGKNHSINLAFQMPGKIPLEEPSSPRHGDDKWVEVGTLQIQFYYSCSRLAGRLCSSIHMLYKYAFLGTRKIPIDLARLAKDQCYAVTYIATRMQSAAAKVVR